jgi:Circularly permutated YpsA SLOG family/Glycosyl transferase family 2
MKIISGGQTGVDRAALDAALSLGVPCGGWCPAGRLDENGIIPSHYPLQELPGGGYLERTERNVSDADGTAIIHSGLLTGGTQATADFCAKIGKPLCVIDASRVSPTEAAEQLQDFVRAQSISLLNIAGPRASQWREGYDFARQTLTQFLSEYLARSPAPKISFIVPAHNEEHELPLALHAIDQAAVAARTSYELIVVDDASNDETGQIAAQFGVRLVRINRRQIAAARNAGARLARGDILFFVDADTHIAPVHVARARAALDEGYSGGSARVGADGQLSFFGAALLRFFSTIYFATGLGAGAFLFTRRELFEAVGGFDEQYFAGEEVYFSLALKKRGRFVILREPVITSARKLRTHSPGFVLGQVFFLILGGKRALRSRDRLALWYGERIR